VDADIAAARSDVGLERRLLRGVEHVTGRRKPDDRLVLREVRGGELIGVLGRRDREAVGGAELLDGGDPVGDRRVAESSRLAEHEDPCQRCRFGRCGLHQDAGAQENCEAGGQRQQAFTHGLLLRAIR
jgi:hypothetical protein